MIIEKVHRSGQCEKTLLPQEKDEREKRDRKGLVLIAWPGLKENRMKANGLNEEHWGLPLWGVEAIGLAQNSVWKPFQGVKGQPVKKGERGKDTKREGVDGSKTCQS